MTIAVSFISALILWTLTFAEINFRGFYGFLANPQNLSFSSIREIIPHAIFLGVFLARFQSYSGRISNLIKDEL